MSRDLRKDYPLENILYDDFYRVKLPFAYYLFSKSAVFIVIISYLLCCVLNDISFEAYSSICFFALMLGYKMFFKGMRGNEFDIWLIKIVGDFVFSMKKKYREFYA